MTTLAMRLRAARLSRGLTQRQLADALGLDRASISDYETQGISPRVDTIEPLCRTLGISADWLFGITGSGEYLPEVRGQLIDAVYSSCAVAFDVSVDDIKGRRRISSIAAARQLVAWMLYEVLGMNYVQVGKVMRFDRTSVMYMCRQVDAWQTFDLRRHGRMKEALAMVGSSDIVMNNGRLRHNPQFSLMAA